MAANRKLEDVDESGVDRRSISVCLIDDNAATTMEQSPARKP